MILTPQSIIMIMVMMIRTTRMMMILITLLLVQWGDRYFCKDINGNVAGLSVVGGKRASIKSGFNQSQVMHIVYALDQIMMPLTIVSVKSVIEVTRDTSLLSFHFVTVGLTWTDDFLLDMKRSLCADCRFESSKWNPPAIIKAMKVRKTTRQDLAAAPNYARFYISQLFPRLHRFIYLDNDVIAVQPLDDLWHTSLGPHVVGMVHDCGSWFYDHVVTHENYNLSHPVVRDIFGDSILNNSCHPNAGVMLVDQRQFVATLQLQKIERLIQLNQQEFLYKLGSQPLIVLSCWNNYLPLSDRWNVRNFSLLEDSAMVHFNGRSRKIFMYKVLLALAHDYSESNTRTVSKWHMKGVQMDGLDLLWDRLAVQIMRNSTASFASHVFQVSQQSREHIIQTDETVQQFVEDAKIHHDEKKKVKSKHRTNQIMAAAACGYDRRCRDKLILKPSR